MELLSSSFLIQELLEQLSWDEMYLQLPRERNTLSRQKKKWGLKSIC